MRKLGVRGMLLLASAMPVVAVAQTAPPQQPAAPAQEAPADDMGEEIVVTGELRGAVPGPIKPEVSLSPADIRTYGASNVTELLNALSAQLGTDGTPVILLSGRRSSFSEIRTIPTEAIERIDILPEEVALQYGYAANQKVVNFVLRNRFQALTTVLEGAMPTAGGNTGEGGTANIFKLNRNSRIELNVKYAQNSGLTEDERGVARSTGTLFDTRGNITGFSGAEIDPALSAAAGTPVTIAGVPVGADGAAPTLAGFVGTANRPNVAGPSMYRTLSGGGNNRRFGDDLAPLSAVPMKNLEINGSYAPHISDKTSGTLTFEYSSRETEALNGLPSATLRLPTGSPYSPFTRDVQLLRYYDNLAPLSRSSENRSFNTQLSLNGSAAPWSDRWQWSLQANYQLSSNESVVTTGIDAAPIQALIDARTPGFNPFAALPYSAVLDRSPQLSNSSSNLAAFNFSTFGSIFKLPAGDVRVTLSVTGRTFDQNSKSSTLGVTQAGKLGRDSASVRGNVTLPITSRNGDVLPAIGDLSINGNFAVEQVSSFGRLTTTGYGVNWTPTRGITASVNVSNEDIAPSEGNLADPLQITPNQRVYDFVRNENVDITTIRGGNPALIGGSRREFSASLRVSLIDNLNIRTRYSNQRILNPTSTLPGATAEIEAAFPSRFLRDASGRLLSIDYRPVNFARSDQSRLTTTLSFSTPISSPQAKRMIERRDAFMKAREESRRTGQPMPAEMTAMFDQFRRLGQQASLFGSPRGRGQGQPGQGPDGQRQGQVDRQRGEGQGQRPDGNSGGGGGGFRGPGGGGPGGGGGGRGGFGGGGGGNQARFELTHTWLIKDESLIRTGLPVIDRLDGAGNRAAHQIDATAAVKRDAWLVQIGDRWQSSTQRLTGTLGSQTRLTTDSLNKVDFLTEFNPGQNIDFLLKHPWLRGSRIQFKIENILNAKPRTRDQAGITPANYVPNLQDPIGRIIRLTFRKQFF